MIMAFPPHDQSFMFQNHEHLQDHLIPSSSTTSVNCNAFPASLHFGIEGGGGGVPCLMLKRSMSFSGIENKYRMMREDEEAIGGGGGEEEAWDHEGWRTIGGVGEKKKRLSIEQVKTLEKSFEAGNKLEGERKMQLAKSLGLEPRQIAIWFQNRRARWKTKQLEKEYEALKRQFDSLKSQNHALKAHNLQLHAQLQALKGRDCSEEGGTMGQLKKETEICWSNGSEINSWDINLDTSRTQVISSGVLPTKPNGITQLLQCSSQSQPQDESLSHMFHGIDDDEHHNFWPWPDHHHPQFHH